MSYLPEHLTKAICTAFVSTLKNKDKRPYDLGQLLHTPAFEMFAVSVQKLAEQQGCSPEEAAEEMLRIIRRVDDIWRDYVFQEGIERIRNL